MIVMIMMMIMIMIIVIMLIMIIITIIIMIMIIITTIIIYGFNAFMCTDQRLTARFKLFATLASVICDLRREGKKTDFWRHRPG